MRRTLSTRGILLLTALLAAAVMIGSAALFDATGWAPRASPVPTEGGGVGPGYPTVYRNLTIAYDPLAGDYVYTQTQLWVPADVLVVFTIVNYDPMRATLPAAGYARVSGTWNEQMQLAYGANGEMVDGLPTNDVSHTFTMSDSYYQVNVPIPPAESGGVPARVTFSLVFHFPGPYFAWGCVAYCGGPQMEGMYGSLTVGST